VEALEARNLLSVFAPAQIRQAYGFDQVTFSSGTVAGDGAGQTIAIVDAYDHPTVAQDLDTFDQNFSINGGSQSLYQQYGSSSTVLTKVDQWGGASYPAYSSGWSQEIALDVEWAHAVAPAAHILLVEAASTSFFDMFAAVDYASAHASVVSMSWGSGEFSGETSYDGHFNPNFRPGVTFVASSGDTGAVPEYPAVSPYVLAVGGTSLSLTSSSSYLSETGWNGSGGGVSSYESKPPYQSSVTQSSTKRTNPDVAYNADPYTGVYVVWQGGLYAFGGTSAGAPQWAGLVAIANQGRGGAGTLTGATQTLPTLYSLTSSTSASDSNPLHDVVSGSTRRRGTTLRAGTGYDLVTGKGTPKAQLVISALVNPDRTVTIAPFSTGSGSGTGGSGSRHHAQLVVGAVDNRAAIDGVPVLTATLTSAPAVVIFAPQPMSAQATSLVIAVPQARPPQTLVTSRVAVGETALPTEGPIERMSGEQGDSASRRVTPAWPAVAARQEEDGLLLGPARSAPARAERVADDGQEFPETAPIQEETSAAAGPLAALAAFAFAFNGFWVNPAAERLDAPKRRTAGPHAG